jgi:hypothetical protein
MQVLSGRWRVIAVATESGFQLYVNIGGTLNPDSISGSHPLFAGSEVGWVDGDEIVVTFAGSYHISGPGGSAGGFSDYVPTSELEWVANQGLTVRAKLDDTRSPLGGLNTMEVHFVQEDKDNPIIVPRPDFTIPESYVRWS